MALKHGDTYYMDFYFCENGVNTHRKVQELLFQDRFGMPHRVAGQDLPNTLNVQTGRTNVGANTAEILLAPGEIIRCDAPPHETSPSAIPRSWPTWRDFGCFALGLYAFLMANFFITVFGL